LQDDGDLLRLSAQGLLLHRLQSDPPKSLSHSQEQLSCVTQTHAATTTQGFGTVTGPTSICRVRACPSSHVVNFAAITTDWWVCADRGGRLLFCGLLRLVASGGFGLLAIFLPGRAKLGALCAGSKERRRGDAVWHLLGAGDTLEARVADANRLGTILLPRWAVHLAKFTARGCATKRRNHVPIICRDSIRARWPRGASNSVAKQAMQDESRERPPIQCPPTPSES
jgi:hypothetical protein